LHVGDALEDSLSHLLRNVSMKYRYYVYSLLGKDKWGVSKDLAIYHVSQSLRIDQKGLADKLNITPATVSVIVNQMESDGLLTRIQDEKDGRRLNLMLTEKGQSLVSKVKNSWLKIEAKLTEEFQENEKEKLFQLLQKLDKNLDDLIRQNY
jgi:DNA-binding MarR family transcriptional regulator